MDFMRCRQIKRNLLAATILGATISFFGCSPEASTQREEFKKYSVEIAKPLQNVEGVVINEKLPQDAVKSLEALLIDGNDTAPSAREAFGDKPTTLDIDKFPSLAYTLFITEKKSKEGGVDVSAYSPSGGSCFIINKEGFFLTSYHVIDEFLLGKRDGKPLLLIHDPIKGLLERAKILAYSTKEGDDIALGKVDVPKNVDFPNTSIMKRDPVYPAWVYSSIFTNGAFIADTLRVRASKIWYEGLEEDGKNHQLWQVDYKRLGIKLPAGTISNELKWVDAQRGRSIVVDTQGQGIFDVKEDLRYEGDGQSPRRLHGIIRGNSGGPVFNSRGELVGIISSILNPDLPVETDAHPVFFVGATRIRQVIGDYVKACKISQ